MPPPSPPARGDASPWKKTIGIPEGGWTPIHVVWGVLAMIVLVAIEAGVIGAFDPDFGVAATLSVQALLAATLVAVALVFASRGSSLPIVLRELGLRRFARSALGLAAVTYVAYIIFAAIYAAIVSPEQEDVTRDLGFEDGGVSAVAAGALIVVAAPFSEEIFFRGFMYGGLRRRLPVWAAALIAGAIFGLLHYTGPDSIGVVPQLAALGVILAWLYEQTGSLWPPIILHVVNNSIALTYVTST
jgi:membrane protease YdiL (CAAX protease family)